MSRPKGKNWIAPTMAEILGAWSQADGNVFELFDVLMQYDLANMQEGKGRPSRQIVEARKALSNIRRWIFLNRLARELMKGQSASEYGETFLQPRKKRGRPKQYGDGDLCAMHDYSESLIDSGSTPAEAYRKVAEIIGQQDGLDKHTSRRRFASSARSAITRFKEVQKSPK